MDAQQLSSEGYFNKFIRSGARIEPAGCSLCMGNQARVKEGSSVVSTSTRNFPHRLGTDANVFLASAELSAIAAMLGKMPTVEQYHWHMDKINATREETYRYLNFDTLSEYQVAEKRRIDVITI
jgi:aconitate hydratase 2/2-methylisocitrate dehydratase